jgi:hypothetical protein
MKYNFYLIIIFVIGGCYNSINEKIDTDLDSIVVKKDSSNANISVNNSESFDFLKIYTYLLDRKYKGKYMGNGSCFFFRAGNESFVVTAHHVLSPYNVFTNDIGTDTDTVILILKNKSAEKPLGFIPLIEYYEALHKQMDIHKGEIDIFKLKLQNSESLDVNYINNFIDTSYFNRIPDSIFSYGYPAETLSQSGIDASPLKGEYISFKDWYNKKEASNPFLRTRKSSIDSFDSRYFFISNIPLGRGVSGSPVFGKFSIDNNKGRGYATKFVGLLFGVEEETKRTWVLKAKYVCDYLNQLKN